MNGLSVLTITAECDDCYEEVTSVIRCRICEANYCEDCAGKKIKTCDICNWQVCPECLVVCSFNNAKICCICFDKLFIIKTNYESLTQGINEALEESKAAKPHQFRLALGVLGGRLQGLKNRFGF